MGTSNGNIQVFKRFKKGKRIKNREKNDNKKHIAATEISHYKNAEIIERFNEEIEILNKQIKQIEKEMRLILESDQELKEKVEKIE